MTNHPTNRRTNRRDHRECFTSINQGIYNIFTRAKKNIFLPTIFFYIKEVKIIFVLHCIVYIDMGTVNADPDYAVMLMTFDSDNHGTFQRLLALNTLQNSLQNVAIQSTIGQNQNLRDCDCVFMF